MSPPFDVLALETECCEPWQNSKTYNKKIKTNIIAILFLQFQNSFPKLMVHVHKVKITKPHF